MARRRTSFVNRMRWVLLALLIVMVGGIVGLVLFGRAGEQMAGALDLEAEASDEWDEGVAVLGEEFEFTLQQEGRPIFRIRGDATRSDRDDRVFLEKVILILPREDGEYELESEAATYDQKRHEARLEGNVKLRGPQGIEMRTTWLDLRQRGTILVASKGTDFGVGDRLVGRAENLRMDLTQDLIVLSGGVTLSSRRGSGPPLSASEGEPFSMTARRIVLEKAERRLMAEGEVIVNRGFEHLEAERVSLFLDEELQKVQFLRALREVKGRVLPPVGSALGRQRLHFRGDSLALLFDATTDDPAKMTLEGKRRRPALLRTLDDAGSERRLTALYLTSDLESGLLQTSEALGPLTLVERNPEGRVVRTASAQRGDARFDARGYLSGISMEGGVQLKEADVTATSDRAFLDLERQRAELHGDPVHVTTASGELEAPRVVYSQETGLVHAFEGVRAALDEAAVGEAGPIPMARSDEPVRVEAEESFLRREPQSFLFRGGVRAWQGRNLVLAEQLRGEESSRMSASGGVKTIWHPAPADGDPGSEETDGAQEQPPPERRPVEITAEHMSYAQSDGLLLYNGDVVALQAGRTLRCNEMDVEMGEGSQAERLHCRGDAVFLDPATERRIEGREAIYFVTPGEVLFYGDPLRMQDPARGRVEARRLRYRLEDGQLWMGAAAESSQPSG